MRIVKIALVGIGLLLLAGAALVWHRPGYATLAMIWLGMEEAPRNDLTLEERLALIAPAAAGRLKPYFVAAAVPYPPAAVTLVGLKSDRVLQLYAKSDAPDAAWKLIHSYPIRAASGHLGPKLAEGDKQVPEGVYGIDLLNPNSKFNVSMRVNYPNAFDRARAAEEHRKDLGGAIMIHGRASSIGCLAMGDPAAEELFTLVHDVGLTNVTVVLAPLDLRTQPRPAIDSAPAWLPDLYDRIEAALKPLPLPGGSAS